MNIQEKVQQLWGSPIVVGSLDITPLVNAAALEAVAATGPRLEATDQETVLADRAELEAEFLASFVELAKAEDRPEPTGVELQVQIWRGGYDLPSAGFAADFVGWCFLNAGDTRAHDESGAVSVADPRAGSAMTAMPGLPFGRQVIIRHQPGAHLAVPGWLTCSVVPVEAGQRAVVAFATSRR